MDGAAVLDEKERKSNRGTSLGMGHMEAGGNIKSRTEGEVDADPCLRGVGDT